MKTDIENGSRSTSHPGKRNPNVKYEDAEMFARSLRYAADCIQYCTLISQCHNCNNCGKREKCQYAPRLGEIVRINCPLWEEKVNKG